MLMIYLASKNYFNNMEVSTIWFLAGVETLIESFILSLSINFYQFLSISYLKGESKNGKWKV